MLPATAMPRARRRPAGRRVRRLGSADTPRSPRRGARPPPRRRPAGKVPAGSPACLPAPPRFAPARPRRCPARAASLRSPRGPARLAGAAATARAYRGAALSNCDDSAYSPASPASASASFGLRAIRARRSPTIRMMGPAAPLEPDRRRRRRCPAGPRPRRVRRPSAGPRPRLPPATKPVRSRRRPTVPCRCRAPIRRR